MEQKTAVKKKKSLRLEKANGVWLSMLAALVLAVSGVGYLTYRSQMNTEPLAGEAKNNQEQQSKTLKQIYEKRVRDVLEASGLKSANRLNGEEAAAAVQKVQAEILGFIVPQEYRDFHLALIMSLEKAKDDLLKNNEAELKITVPWEDGFKNF